MTEQQLRKQHIRSFMRNHYSDEKLAELLAHARDGKLAYMSCCCFIGIATANHALQGRGNLLIVDNTPHLVEAFRLAGAKEAEVSYQYLARANPDDASRVRILIPMIRAEMRVREVRAQQNQEILALVYA